MVGNREVILPDGFPETLAEAELLKETQRKADIQEHLLTLFDLVLETKAKRVIELGVYWGCSTLAFLCGVRRTGGMLFSCDHGEFAPTRKKMMDLGFETYWDYQVRDDRDLGKELRSVGQEVDIVFIDTSHEALHTAQELELFPPLVRVGGYLILHDTVSYRNGVLIPLIQWLQVHPGKWSYENWTNNNGLAVLQRLEKD